MNLLTGALPAALTIGGAEWPIRADFRVGVRFELLMQDRTLSDEEHLARALTLYYPEIPADLPGAVDGLLWFYSCGKKKPPEPQGGSTTKTSRRAYDFGQDDGLILAAFRQAYGIDLTTAELHWWAFRALLAALPADCEFCRVCGYRTIDTKGMGKQQKQHYEKMRKLYALKDGAAGTTMTLAERDRSMKDYVAQRFAETSNKKTAP